MVKNKIYRYFLKEIFKSFVTILFAFSIIAWTVRSVNFLELIVDDGHSLKTYLYFSALNITNIVTKFIPLSFLIALNLSILKFEKQNELIILWTSGIKKIKIINLVFFVSFFVLILHLIFSVFVTPNALNKSRFLVKESTVSSFNILIKSKINTNYIWRYSSKSGLSHILKYFRYDEKIKPINNSIYEISFNENGNNIQTIAV